MMPYDDDAKFDIVTLHTVISYVDDLLKVLDETLTTSSARGTVSTFDGDQRLTDLRRTDDIRWRPRIEENSIRNHLVADHYDGDMSTPLADAGLW